jgi:DNA mismatch endonuclease, patch repair protein
MSRIRSKDTKPEVLLRSALHREGFRFRKNDNRLPGKPDIVLPKYRTIIFLHGCFWHRHKNCHNATMPKTNIDFWQSKFARNGERDKEVKLILEELGWHVVLVWECEISSPEKLNAKTKALAGMLESKQDWAKK